MFFINVIFLKDKKKEKTSLLLPLTLEYLKDLVPKIQKDILDFDIPDITISKDEDDSDVIPEFEMPELQMSAIQHY